MIIKLINKNRILFLIILLAAILRLWNLSNIPPHPRNDEAALGYNAYSVLLTSRDEHGEFLPFIFQSFGDWKMGGYVYSTIPFITIFGLNEFAVRLPSAISGIITPPLIYLISLQIFANKRLSLISAALFAISPLFIAFSRGAWEVNLSLFLTLAAIFFFLQAVNVNDKFLMPWEQVIF